jgi:flavoprotein
MACELCGGGDLWIKTCLTPSGSRLLVCDPCWEEHRPELTIVPGDRVVTARCSGCGRYSNPREFSDVALGGRKNAYSGTCRACAGKAGPRRNL